MQELRRVCIVGGSLAGLRAAEALRVSGYDRAIIVLAAETSEPYNRPPLSKHFLTDGLEDAAVSLPVRDELGLEWHAGMRATSVSVEERSVTTTGQTIRHLDAIIIATGAAPRRLDLPALRGIHTLRTLDDARRLRDAIRGGGPVIIAGAGLIGCEIASSCRELGVAVTVVDPDQTVMRRALGELAAEPMLVLHRAAGTDLRLGSSIRAVHGSQRVQAAELSDGSCIATDTIVVCIGARPDTDWLEGSGLPIDDGILCDEHQQVLGTDGHVLAVGDVSRWHRHDGLTERSENWTAATEQAAIAAQTLLHGPSERPPRIPFFWTEQYHHRLQVVGRPAGARKGEIVARHDDAWAMRLTRDGMTVAVAALDMPGQIAKARRELAAINKDAELAGLSS